MADQQRRGDHGGIDQIADLQATLVGESDDPDRGAGQRQRNVGEQGVAGAEAGHTLDPLVQPGEQKLIGAVTHWLTMLAYGFMTSS